MPPIEPTLPAPSAQALLPASKACRLPRLVLDTNVVLDWLLFSDPRCDALARAVTAGRAHWLASAAMRGELQHVLGRGIKATPFADPVAILDAWDRWATPVAASVRPTLLRCSDRDDQKFIDLALETGATALLSRDRAVLKLARRAHAFGLEILTAQAWCRAAGRP